MLLEKWKAPEIELADTSNREFNRFVVVCDMLLMPKALLYRAEQHVWGLCRPCSYVWILGNVCVSKTGNLDVLSGVCTGALWHLEHPLCARSKSSWTVCGKHAPQHWLATHEHLKPPAMRKDNVRHAYNKHVRCVVDRC